MKSFESRLLLILLLTFLLKINKNSYFVFCDLPVHCLKHDVQGLWLFRATELILVNNRYDMKCGHHIPGDSNANLAFSSNSFSLEYTIELNENNSATLKRKDNSEENYSGTWTMVYNQGILVEFNKLSFFAFSYYTIEVINSTDLVKHSKCYQTSVGWYMDNTKNKRGCFKGYKLGVNNNLDTFIINEKNMSEFPDTNNSILESNRYHGVKVINAIPFDDRAVNHVKVIHSPLVPRYHGISTNSFLRNPIPNVKVVHVNTIPHNPHIMRPTYFDNVENLHNLIGGESKYISDSFPTSTLISSRFKQINDMHLKRSRRKPIKHKIGNSMNKSASNINISKRENHINFLTIKERTLSNAKDVINVEYQPSLTSKFKTNSKILSSDTFEDISMFPKHFDWKHVVRPAFNQGACGSCYVISSLKMAEARLKISYNHDIQLSVQSIINCSYYSQGCDGGFPILAMKYAADFEMVPEYCSPYNGKQGNCLNRCNINNLKYVYKFINYYYVGGAYRKCTEKLMMSELFVHGPFVVSISNDEQLLSHKTGVFSSKSGNLNSWVLNGKKKPSFVKVDHSMLLVGWGEEENPRTGLIEKFWILQNTWGTSWGEDGYFKIRRGIDELGVESMCEAGIPVIVDSMTKLPLSPKQFKNQSIVKLKINQKPVTLD